MQVEVTKFETGAVRDAKKIPMRWDLISGLALLEIAKVCHNNEFCNWQHYSPMELIGFSINSVYTFVSGDRNQPHISIAFRHLMYACHNQFTPPERIERIYQSESARSNGLQNLCYPALNRMASTCEEGRDKYGEWNWLYGFPLHTTLSHALDHMYAICDGQDEEDDWGHALWNLHISIHTLQTRPDLIGLRLDPNYTLTPEIKKYLEDLRIKREAELARGNSKDHVNGSAQVGTIGSGEVAGDISIVRQQSRGQRKVCSRTTRVSGKQKQVD